jgi:hypothetical protein
MAARLHKSAFEHAKQLERDAWSEHQPSTHDENEFIRQHGLNEYGKWHLGVDEAEPPDAKAHYKFPYGDFVDVHRCAVLSAESRAGQYKYQDIESAAAHLHGMIDAK